MPRRVKDYIEISDHTSLDALINALQAIRDSLPEGAEPQLKLRGDDVFGRHMSISYLRELTADEMECASRYRATQEAGDESGGTDDQRDVRRAA